MTIAYIILVLFIFGAALGSFAAATVWRMRAAEIGDDTHRKKDKAELGKLKRVSVLSDHSLCLHCGHRLRWYDMIPVVSWLVLGGKCRDCRKPIGYMEFLAEVGLGAAFVGSYLLWPYTLVTSDQWLLFAIWLAILVVLAIQWMYDAKWYYLLTNMTVLLGVFSIMYFFVQLSMHPAPMPELLWRVALLLLIMPGFYGLLCFVSRESWVGRGDVYLLVPFAFLLPSWEYGILLVFLANLIGCIVLIPAMVSKKVSRGTRVPFGPFLIAGLILTVLLGQKIILFYVARILF